MSRITRSNDYAEITLGAGTGNSPSYLSAPPRADACKNCTAPQSGHVDGHCPFESTLYEPLYASRNSFVSLAMSWLNGQPLEEAMALIMYYASGGK